MMISPKRGAPGILGLVLAACLGYPKIDICAGDGALEVMYWCLGSV